MFCLLGCTNIGVIQDTGSSLDMVEARPFGDGAHTRFFVTSFDVSSPSEYKDRYPMKQIRSVVIALAVLASWQLTGCHSFWSFIKWSHNPFYSGEIKLSGPSAIDSTDWKCAIGTRSRTCREILKLHSEWKRALTGPRGIQHYELQWRLDSGLCPDFKVRTVPANTLIVHSDPGGNSTDRQDFDIWIEAPCDCPGGRVSIWLSSVAGRSHGPRRSNEISINLPPCVPP